MTKFGTNVQVAPFGDTLCCKWGFFIFFILFLTFLHFFPFFLLAFLLVNFDFDFFTFSCKAFANKDLSLYMLKRQSSPLSPIWLISVLVSFLTFSFWLSMTISLLWKLFPDNQTCCAILFTHWRVHYLLFSHYGIISTRKTLEMAKTFFIVFVLRKHFQKENFGKGQNIFYRV